MYYLCEKYYKPATVQDCTDDCVSWVPRLPVLDFWTNWMYEHALGMELIRIQGTNCNVYEITSGLKYMSNFYTHFEHSPGSGGSCCSSLHSSFDQWWWSITATKQIPPVAVERAVCKSLGKGTNLTSRSVPSWRQRSWPQSR